MMLTVSRLSAGYGQVQVLREVNLTVAPGEVLCLMGRNGAGKSTALKGIMGLVRATGGEISLNGVRIDTLPAYKVPGLGIGYVPQGRRLFSELTVAENLQIGLAVRGHDADRLEHVLALFPRLRDRMGQTSGSLSGGEQQMLAIGRALCVEPAVLLLDEPTEGLQPSMIALIQETVLKLRATGVATVVVEQRVDAALAISNRITFLVNGRSADTVATRDMSPVDPLFARYVGI